MLKVYGKMFIKAFFIQALWNFERLQNIGFLFVLKPFLDKVYLNPERKKEAMMRHTGFFNTHPYMANVIVAVTANAERHIAENPDKEESQAKEINFMKNAMAGPLAAIGDSFFWGTLRPVTAFISIFLVILFSKVLDQEFSWIVPLVFLFLYNCIHIPVRYWILFISFKLDKETIAIISKLEFKFLGDMVRYAGLLIVLVSMFLYFTIFGLTQTGNVNFLRDAVPDAVFFGIILVLATVFGRIRAVFMFYCVILLCVLMSYLGM